VFAKHESFRGDFVPPRLLRDLEEAMPGAGREVLDLTKARANHRMQLERDDSDASRRGMQRGQFLGALIACLGLLLAAAVATTAKTTAAMFVASVIAVVGVGGPSVAMALAKHRVRDDGRKAAKK
jgi:uncharacterized membrane protein